MPSAREGAEVARVVPALGVDRGGRGLRVLPVPLEAARTAGQDLAVVGDPHLDARGSASPTVPMTLRSGRVNVTTGPISVAP